MSIIIYIYVYLLYILEIVEPKIQMSNRTLKFKIKLEPELKPNQTLNN